MLAFRGEAVSAERRQMWVHFLAQLRRLIIVWEQGKPITARRMLAFEISSCLTRIWPAVRAV